MRQSIATPSFLRADAELTVDRSAPQCKCLWQSPGLVSFPDARLTASRDALSCFPAVMAVWQENGKVSPKRKSASE